MSGHRLKLRTYILQALPSTEDFEPYIIRTIRRYYRAAKKRRLFGKKSSASVYERGLVGDARTMGLSTCTKDHAHGAVVGGHIELALWMTTQADSWAAWEGILAGAAEIGNYALCVKALDNGASASGALHNAGTGGHMPIVKLLREKTSAGHGALNNACRHNHTPVIKYLIDKGEQSWGWGLAGACEGGNLLLARDMIRRGARSWSDSLFAAAKGGHLDLLILIIAEIDASGQPFDCWQRGISAATMTGNVIVVKMMLSRFKPNQSQLNHGLYCSCECNKPATARLMVERGAMQCSCRHSMEEHLTPPAKPASKKCR
jgi:hypothetical protein